ncbi:Zn-ribbon domain-containing OB-fold protein [Verminephrobacter eiseniae]|uniref:DUF35 domain-containing protein n=1 Tax=Verminephrobacter eiseniae (strain EF01-2) TaxID=391735 RepID=A1WM13_VEREI|nr:OB-fold domain-containing protein [Verminephrobacter eiseniae]ABM58670.1 protein of unknown function DUF35 [Verminephrobacter eiseniae EF01-2]MCW5230723.1 DNA-binding protein [Verminephrobacter eiseniae]MCW5259101.1 DNA-binding protein [Verminephrobacter eiseniae]MCW5284241.1 DNA-binding protein [Verminephrobacter eiseniae]MCW5292456.1 DNA-binding protein [Verminephrobacter eiseniae]
MNANKYKPKPVPVPTPVTQPFWDGTRAGELRLQQCKACLRHVMYPRLRCPQCGAAGMHWIRATGRGRLYSYVINHFAAPGWEGETPYVIAVVELEEGPRMLSNLVGVAPRPECLTLDMPLEVVFEGRGDQTLPMFKPAPARVPR